ncbi:abc-type cobalt transport atpase component [Leptolyngbya sp. Heron Island J]|uniref:energy-coupling factor ABC transporter ATP-binding protein n=1 Tax=Leptolyngbya sp. Heron Island J TaxID=1385935 RepID=UPI0003B97577|nr:energy-coupling factor ABC transporter ATP-binding protein [Leptolyngbya sp. Heron Island J]ESA35017.1 abc-type cobalt transport atpase component [Leptolyngbya sp. Heron Island J]
MTSLLPKKTVDSVVLPATVAAIAVEHLCFSYPDRPQVLDDICLQISPGQRVGIIGHNGCGKTTLFMTLCGALTPTSGTVRLMDKPVVTGGFNPQIGLLFQNPNNQLFSASVREDIRFGPANMNLPPHQVEERVDAAIALTGLQPLAERPPHHLSGGEKQMVAIAGLLAMKPQIVLYDEPTASLDIRSRRRLITFMQGLQQTMVIASHDLEFLLEVCDRALIMYQGKIVADGPPREIMGDDRLMHTYDLEKPHSLIPHTINHHQ